MSEMPDELQAMPASCKPCDFADAYFQSSLFLLPAQRASPPTAKNPMATAEAQPPNPSLFLRSDS